MKKPPRLSIVEFCLLSFIQTSRILEQQLWIIQLEMKVEKISELATHLLLYLVETRADEHLEQTCDHNPAKYKYQTI